MSRELAQEILMEAKVGAPGCQCCSEIATTTQALLAALDDEQRERADLIDRCNALAGEVERLRETVRVAKIMFEVSK